jgi:hypothetical protein
LREKDPTVNRTILGPVMDTGLFLLGKMIKK